MAVKVAINGLGRIGRCILRAVGELKRDDIEVVAVNGPADTKTHYHLLRYDSIHGTYADIKQTGEDELDLGYGSIPVFHERDPAKLPWGDLGVDIVLECTGVFKSKEKVQAHLDAGAKRVIISAPGENVDATVVYGVNHDILKAEDTVISIGSCTTNCLAPVAKVLQEEVGIRQGFMTTIHAYTNDQNIMDNRHKDLRRARGAALSAIPTSTGAAKAIGLVLPELAGKLDGTAIRVPTPNVSLVDLTFTAEKETSVEAINKAMQQAASGALKGVLAYNEELLVSIDFTHNPNSAIFDATGTKVVNGNFVRVMSWYDNEWGFSVRMLDVAAYMSSLV